MFVKVNNNASLTAGGVHLSLSYQAIRFFNQRSPRDLIMKKLMAATLFAGLTAMALPNAAAAGCYNCYAPPPCQTCYQQQVVPPQYRTVEETVMVSPGRTIARRTPPQYETVMVPKTVMVAPSRVEYEQIPPEYATQQRVQMVAPAQTYYVPVRPRCGSCGY
jgi:hypothetical protein